MRGIFAETLAQCCIWMRAIVFLAFCTILTRILFLFLLQSTAVPYIPDGYSQKEWQTEHEAELAELQSRKEEYIGHRGAAAQPVRHLSEDIDAKTHVHFHKPLSSNGSDGRAADDEGETVLQKMRRQWGRDDDSLIP